MKESLAKAMDNIFEKDDRYAEDAYEFIMEALAFTQKKFKRDRHVSGEEILEGIKLLLMKQFGPLTLTVLDHWGIENTEDFGNIVHNLVNSKVLKKTKEDDISKFKNAYDFQEVFQTGYRKKLHKKVSRMRSAGGII